MTSIRRFLTVLSTKSSLHNFSQEDFISYLPLTKTSIQFMDIYIPMITISTVWFADKNALKTTLIKTLQDVKPSCFIGVPKIWDNIKDNINVNINNNIISKISKVVIPQKILESVGLDKCIFAISTDGSISTSTLDFFNNVGLQINNSYELDVMSGPISICYPSLNKYDSVGYPLVGVKIDDDGEILIKCNNLFNNEWLKTGDIGKIDSDGFLYILGKKKEMIVLSSNNIIFPNIIENLLYNHLNMYFEHVVVCNKSKNLSIILASPKKLPQNITSIIESTISIVNRQLNNLTLLKKYLILHNKFNIGYELTPTMNVKRSYIQKKYYSKINKLHKN
jgi:long-chain-fatty-acid--CoA ligase ACSBG